LDLIKPNARNILAAFTVCAIFAFTIAFVGSAEAQVAKPGIFIKADGGIEPASVPIQRSGNVYTFTDDIYTTGISIAKEGITLDGAGHMLMGPYNGTQTQWIIGGGPNQTPTNEPFWTGIDLGNNFVVGLTIKNLNIKNFSIGMYLWTANNTLVGNAFDAGIVGILLSGNNNSITDNYIGNNKMGIYFGSNEPGNVPQGVVLSGNRFENNLRQLSGCVCVDFNVTETKHTWDNGSRGNFWSDYAGADGNGDGIGDTPYVIDVLNEDRFPLMQSSAGPPTVTPEVLSHVLFGAAVGAVVVAVVVVVVFRRRKKNER
jgi:hypothetical protein